jgi:hypothetical protein
MEGVSARGRSHSETENQRDIQGPELAFSVTHSLRVYIPSEGSNLRKRQK